MNQYILNAADFIHKFKLAPRRLHIVFVAPFLVFLVGLIVEHGFSEGFLGWITATPIT
jgi:hypothetical protein